MHIETRQEENRALDRITANFLTLSDWLRQNPEPSAMNLAVRTGMSPLAIDASMDDEEQRWHKQDFAKRAEAYLRNFGMWEIYEIAHERWEAQRAVVVGARVRS